MRTMRIVGGWAKGFFVSALTPFPQTPYRGLGGEFEGRSGDLAYEKSPGPPLNFFYPTRSGPLMMGLPVAAAMDRSMPG